jgi:RNA polymerase sigma factor (TIGR02999 family)
LLRRVYGELKRIAVSQLRGESAGHTLQPTALVHEAYLRLVGQQGLDWRDRAHFFGLASTMMRRVLVDHARARMAGKRRREEGTADVTLAASNGPEVALLDLDRALVSFAERYPRQARVVEMRYFADLEIEEIASCLDVSPATVKRDWQFARAWLSAEMGGGGGR